MTDFKSFITGPVYRRLFNCRLCLFRSRGAFSLVELLMVIAIIGALAAIAIPAFSNYIESARRSRTMSDMRTIDNAITAYALDHNNDFPATLADADVGNLLDAWKNPYEYQILSGGGATPLEDSIGVVLNTDYDLYSKGSDGASAVSAADPTSGDDIVRTNNGQYVGRRSDI
ncbi:MAG: prepilin-type N-terminal cleavage/methylation domain-containing protein [Desulfuromonadaceae bacterium]|nr:prepilin-type N-terminal cleavage/methylation domain-containing protein [Desulfuromonadaceae bacterium]